MESLAFIRSAIFQHGETKEFEAILGRTLPQGAEFHYPDDDDLSRERNEKLTQSVWDSVIIWAEDSDKPSWDDVLFIVDYQYLQWHLLNEATFQHTRKITSQAVARRASQPVAHSVAEHDVHVGNMEHMPAMVYLAGYTQNAGEDWPLAVFRDKEGNQVELLTTDEAHELIVAAAKARNRFESAGNLLKPEVNGYLDIIDDPNGGLDASASARAKFDARKAALDKFQDYQENLDKRLDEALKKLNKQAERLPDDDLPRAKRILVHRLEGTATARMKELKAAEGQNGVDLHAACDDEGRAHTEIAQEKKIGQIRIERAADVAAAKAAAKKATTAINTVRAQRTPLFHRRTTATHTERIVGESIAYAESPVTIRAQHPTWRESKLAIPGEVSLFGHVGLGDDGTVPLGAGMISSTPETVSELGEMDMQLVAPAGKTVEFNLTARSICGSSYLKVTLSPPAKPAE